MNQDNRPLASAWHREPFYDAFEQALGSPQPPLIEEWLERFPPDRRATALATLIAIEVEWQRKAGQSPSAADYIARFPDHREAVDAAFAANSSGSRQTDADTGLAETQRIAIELEWQRIAGRSPSAADDIGQFPNDRQTDGAAELAETHIGDTHQPAQTSDFVPTVLNGSQSNTDRTEHPTLEMVGRYRVLDKLGCGAFGEVYRATDTELQRSVAVKLTRKKYVDQNHAEMFLTEARSVASLDHPHIVPVYDVGRTDTGDFFVVSKLIEGSDLTTALQSRRFSIEETVELVKSIALALHHAHQRGLVHRDVKPANILIDGSGKAYLADFGIALSDDNLGHGPEYVGTPAYMSPEQITGSSHRLDGRSDIFSLGVVLYELLTGKRPFRSDSQLELQKQISSMEAKPLRQIDDTIPEALERICLKGLAKNLNERYATAGDFARDLRDYVSRPTESPASSTGSRAVSPRVILRAGTLVVALLAMGFVFRGVFNAESDVSTTSSQESSSGYVALAAADPEFLLQRFDLLVSRDGQGGFRPISELAPLRNDDAVRFSIRLNQPGHVRLIWIDATGDPFELYPNDPESGHRGDNPVTVLESPIQLDRGWPVEGDVGTETALLLVSRDPLPEIPLEELRVSRAKPLGSRSISRFVATREAAASVVASAGQTRGVGASTRQVDDPVMQLLERMRQHTDIVEAVTIPHDE